MTLRAQLRDELDERISAAQEELRHLQALKRQQPLRLVRPEPSTKRPAADRTPEHTTLVNGAGARLGHKLDLRIAKMSPAGEPTASGRPQHCGPAGLADICGVLQMRVRYHCHEMIFGRLFCLEAKTGNAKQSRVQIAMMRMVRGLGGFYSVIRSVDDAESAYVRARLGMNS